MADIKPITGVQLYENYAEFNTMAAVSAVALVLNELFAGLRSAGARGIIRNGHPCNCANDYCTNGTHCLEVRHV